MVAIFPTRPDIQFFLPHAGFFKTQIEVFSSKF